MNQQGRPQSASSSNANSLTVEVLNTLADAGTVWENLTHLNLHGMGLSKVDLLEEYTPNLEVLVLAFNSFQKVELPSLPKLQSLDLSMLSQSLIIFQYFLKVSIIFKNSTRRASSRHISSTWIYQQTEYLELMTSAHSKSNKHHPFCSLTVEIYKHRCVPQLVELNLLHNGIRETKGYRGIVLRRFHDLQILDKIRVTDSEKVYLPHKLLLSLIFLFRPVLKKVRVP